MRVKFVFYTKLLSVDDVEPPNSLILLFMNNLDHTITDKVNFNEYFVNELNDMQYNSEGIIRCQTNESMNQ